ncbi:maleylpyruvate isomerase family mycothiol-dependent enzyme [Kitasatospora sp. DSM 101779]|uniref:maleylpyruvate isomerase family mycothiol-dependent enzyme n=1 Tax=Kitasatospora sp. DSM 101779 TaxID=2853165 RepID=UPI0021DA40C2|nr:maleylpyruvate isomerase family mycothiol-dependent enzyme [Kitasatospora sp. DSM 101779]MCU7823727.1 maleylpyruvate isomerase family mycothiol-dependent enzyme [Kitasatospora sp. DSM 101779]
MTDNQTVQAYTDAWTQSIESVAELLAPLPTDSWNRPTECPGWSVRDIVSHIIAVESELLGDPRPIHSLPRDLRHVTTDFARYVELPVDKRRCHTPVEITSELEYTVIRRSRALRNARHQPEDLVRWPAGPLSRDISYTELLRNRAFDVWVHEQDLRRALQVPGNLDSPGAVVARDYLVQGLPKVVAKLAGAPAGSTVVFDVSGHLEFLRTVRVNAAGHASVDTSVGLAPDVQFHLDWETYLRLACGRVRPEVAAHTVRVDGDTELAARILAHFALTP